MTMRLRKSTWGSALCLIGFALALALPAPVFADPAEDDPQASERDPAYAAGKQALKSKNWPEAARRFQQAALRDPDNPDLQLPGGPRSVGAYHSSKNK